MPLVALLNRVKRPAQARKSGAMMECPWAMGCLADFLFFWVGMIRRWRGRSAQCHSPKIFQICPRYVECIVRTSLVSVMECPSGLPFSFAVTACRWEVLSGFDAQFGTTCSFTRLSLQRDAPQDVCSACTLESLRWCLFARQRRISLYDITWYVSYIDSLLAVAGWCLQELAWSQHF